MKIWFINDYCWVFRFSKFSKNPMFCLETQNQSDLNFLGFFGEPSHRNLAKKTENGDVYFCCLLRQIFEIRTGTMQAKIKCSNNPTLSKTAKSQTNDEQYFFRGFGIDDDKNATLKKWRTHPVWCKTANSHLILIKLCTHVRYTKQHSTI